MADAVDPIQRDRYGRPYIIPPDGGKPTPYTRATTVAETLDDRYNLERWQERMTAIGLSHRSDLQALVIAHRDKATTKDGKAKLNQICADAKEAAKASGRANLGTALHALAEMADRGLDLGVVPADISRDIDAYRRATDKLTPVHIEQLTVYDADKVAGTPDRHVMCPDGVLRIADLKTGDSVELAQGSIAIQLAIYAHSQLYDPKTGQRTAVDVDLEQAIVIHLPAGGGQVQLHWIDIRQGWDAYLSAMWVRRYRKTQLLRLVEEWSTQPPLPTVEGLVERINHAGSVTDLEAVYFAHVAEWTQQHTELAAARKADLLSA